MIQSPTKENIKIVKSNSRFEIENKQGVYTSIASENQINNLNSEYHHTNKILKYFIVLCIII